MHTHTHARAHTHFYKKQTEIEALRLARAEALDDIANSMRVELEIAGNAFKWTDAPLEVQFADASV